MKNFSYRFCEVKRINRGRCFEEENRERSGNRVSWLKKNHEGGRRRRQRGGTWHPELQQHECGDGSGSLGVGFGSCSSIGVV
ncbi:hypothetical protein LOK49_Contig83G00003 [Camellia lanceoleosa]|nr:hypothetical protein LOK49_Contig83G00003 [Camellia lanceoleosa]